MDNCDSVVLYHSSVTVVIFLRIKDHQVVMWPNNFFVIISAGLKFHPTCSCSFSLVLITLNSLLTTEVWVRSRVSVGNGEKQVDERPARRYKVRDEALLRAAPRDLRPRETRGDALLTYNEEAGNLGESPKTFR